MKKVIRLQDLDCANCAAKMERGIEKIKGVNSVSVDFNAPRKRYQILNNGGRKMPRAKQTMDGNTAVSYTHLDVYKRQHCG